jgi:hypothetical protein
MKTPSTLSPAEARPRWWARAARRAARSLPTVLTLLVNMWPGGGYGYVDFYSREPDEPPPPGTIGGERPPAGSSSTPAGAVAHRRCGRRRRPTHA